MNYFKLLFLCFFSCFTFSQSNKQVSFRELTVEQGLSQNSVVSIAQDSTGYMWFATQDGLNKYDGRGFKFYGKQFEDVTRPTYSKLGKVFIDRLGEIWIISNSGKLERYIAEDDKFKSVQSIPEVSTIYQDHQLNYYFGTYGNGLFCVKGKDTSRVFSEEFKGLNIYDFIENKSSIYIATSQDIYRIKNEKIDRIETENSISNLSSLAKSIDGTVFLGSYGNGLLFKKPNDNSFKKFKGFPSSSLPNNLIILDLLVDKSNQLWIATYGQGAFLINFETKTIKEFKANKNNPYALHYNDVLSLYEDFTGTIWLGTDGAGLSYYDEHLLKFNVITNKQVPNDVSVDVVRAITVNENDIWLGTSGKGLTKLNTVEQNYKTFTTQNSNLASDRIMSLYYENDEVWIGHQGNGLQVLDALNHFTNFPETLNMTIWKIYKDNYHNIWLCTRDNGLIQFDKSKGILKQFNTENSNLTSNNIRTIEQGDNGKIWIGTDDNGLFYLNLENNNINKVNKVPFKIKSLYSKENQIWIGTNGDGLVKYDIKNNSIITFTQQEGLPNLVIYSILPDNEGNLWLSSNKGITKFSFENNKSNVENYANYNGLQAFEFNTGAYFKDEKGTLYFGGLEGVNWFNPRQLSFNKTKPKTVISKVEMFGKEQSIEQNKVFKYNQNTITFTFSGLHFSQPERNQYQYQLVNHDSTWVESGNYNVAHYTNLPPNDYVFKVKSSNYDLVWNKKPATYSFTILKPWYLTNTAKIIYIVLAILTLAIIYKYFKWRWHMKMRLQLEHNETERLKKIDEFKTKLYTNISHEFRTPLTLISGPIDNQLSKPELSQKDKKELSLVKQNANRLLNLVNQMLDLSMIDSGQLKLKITNGNLNILIKQITEAFQYKANEKEIQINASVRKLKNAWFDKDVVEKIISNLLSNAIKYAPKESEILLDAIDQEGALVLSVINVNKDVSQKDLGKLFQRFYQNSKDSEGVGVGLALVKELVMLSNGTILANNIANNKLQFTVTLPITKEAFKKQDFLIDDEVEETLSEPENNYNKSDNAVLLIVEDNKEIRNYIVSNFNKSYKIIEAKNGKSGIEKAYKHMPDLIISDIMMPIKNGIELCNELKHNEITSHIPIVLLTAKVGEENEIEGLKTGADAYITKPFNSEKLKLRVEKLIESRKKLQKHFSKDFNITPEFAITSTEKDFLNKLKEVLDKHLTESDFTSERFSELLLISRTQLHRKLKAIVGMSATEFIRAQRLKLSIEILKTSNATISEVAYQVGFNSPSYFIKCFKEAYHTTPNEYKG